MTLFWHLGAQNKDDACHVTSEPITLHNLLPCNILIHQVTTKTRRYYLDKLLILK